MNIPFTLYMYLLRKFLFSIALIAGIVIFIIILFSFVEMTKMSYGKDISLNIIMQLTLLKLPYLIQKTIPFIVFLACIYCLSNMTKSSELIVARSFGFSVWQFLLPLLMTSFFLGFLFVLAINPISSVLLSKQEKMIIKYMKGDSNIISFSNAGIWLKQKDEDRTIIIRANSAYSQEVILSDVIIFELNNNNQFVRRINAKSAKLENYYWLLEDVTIFSSKALAERHLKYKIPTKLDITELQDNFSHPESVSFWDLPNFIKTIQESGLSATKHCLYFYSLLLYPVFLSAMVLIATSFSLTNPRYGRSGFMIISGIIFGFIIYFFNSLIFTLGSSGRISLIAAAISPTMITILLALSVILHSEDG